MKRISIIFSAIMLFAFASCDNSNERTEKTVLEEDTVSAETEYEVERKVREKEVEIDTTTETETVTRERDLEEDTTGNF